MKTLPITQRNKDDDNDKDDDKIKITKVLKLRWPFKALINRT